MSNLTSALAASGDAALVLEGGEIMTARQILDRAGELERGSAVGEGARILSLDPSPATLLSLLVLAGRLPLQLILGRPSIAAGELGGELQPDLIVTAAGRVEAREGREPAGANRNPGVYLLTSGTSGAPKVVHQTLEALLGRIRVESTEKNRGARWLLTYETHSFAGLQVILSAACSGGVLVVPSGRTPAALARCAHDENVSHISGTPSFWRAVLLARGAEGIPSLRQITLGGEAADQGTIDRLREAFPAARVTHIYASTEAGSLFAVNDGRAGFPAEWLERELPGGVRLRIRGGMLEVLSPRRMVSYASGHPAPATPDGWLRTGDLVAVEGDRAVFRGREDQVVNIAGLKVFPQEVEAFLIAQPMVAEARVHGVPNPLAGALLAAEVVLRGRTKDGAEQLAALRAICARELPPHKIPRRFEAVDSIPVSASGKKVLV